MSMYNLSGSQLNWLINNGYIEQIVEQHSTRKIRFYNILKSWDNVNIEQYNITHCVICSKKLSDVQIYRGTKTCSSSCSKRLRYQSPEERRKTGLASSRSWKNPDRRLKNSLAIKKLWSDKEYHDKRTANIRKGRNRPEVKSKQAESLRQYKLSPIGREKNRQRMRDIWADADKSKNLRRAIADNNRNPEVRQKQYETQKRLGHIRNSKLEDYSYNLLCNYFNSNDILRQYYDKKRYPFKCDFYIKSLDLFIECHYGYRHCGESFDENNFEHQQRLQELKDRAATHKNPNNNNYLQCIYQWTDLDVRKRQCAIDNNLNWLCFYCIDDFEEFLLGITKGDNNVNTINDK